MAITPLSLFSQHNTTCDSIYSLVDVEASYDSGNILEYVNDNLIPILIDCYKRDGIPTTSMAMVLTIDNKGTVIAVVFLNDFATPLCKKELRDEILKMNGWSPGQKNGQAVCTKIVWPIQCIKWLE